MTDIFFSSIFYYESNYAKYLNINYLKTMSAMIAVENVLSKTFPNFCFKSKLLTCIAKSDAPENLKMYAA